jgi:hypothetical protein
VFDDFSDNNDTVNPTWTHLDGAVGSTEQTWEVSSGRYRMTAPPNSTIPELVGYAFVGSYTGPVETDVRVSADFVSIPNADGNFFGVAARLNGDNGIPVFGEGIKLHGFGYQYEGTAGEMVLNIFTGGGNKDVGSQQVFIDPAKSYRFVLEVIGNVLHGQTYEIDSNGVEIGLIGEKFRDFDLEPVNVNDDGDPATPDVPFVPYTSGYSGVYGVGHVFTAPVDITVDNFKSESLAIPGDFDGDHMVDGDDLQVWKNSFGATGADADGDGDTDGADFLVWQRQVGATAATAAVAAIPEPASLCLAGLAAAALAAARRARASAR